MYRIFLVDTMVMCNFWGDDGIELFLNGKIMGDTPRGDETVLHGEYDTDDEDYDYNIPLRN